VNRLIQKLMFISDGPHFGGAERYMVDMATAAKRRGIQPHIHWLPTAGGDTDVFAPASDEGLPVSIADMQRSAYIALTRDFRKLINEYAPHALVINACGRPHFWCLPWLAWSKNIPCLWVQHMVDAGDYRRLPAKWLGGRMEGPHLWRIPQALRHRLAGTAATAVIALNTEDHQRIIRWQGVKQNKLRIIPPGVNLNRFQFDPLGRKKLRQNWGVRKQDNTFLIGAAGRLSEEKGFDLLIDAITLLHKQGISIQTVIAGRGPQANKLREQTKQQNVYKQVQFIDFVENMPAFYSACDLFVLPSKTESFGLALAEAMACNRPVIATPTAGARRQIEHLQTGWQLQSFQPAELAEAIKTLIGDAQLREQLTQNAPLGVRRQFSIEQTLERALRALQGTTGQSFRLRWPGMDETCFAQMASEDKA